MVDPIERLIGGMASGEFPPASFGMTVTLEHGVFVQLMASTPEAADELREYLRLPSTRRAIVDALFDELDGLEDPGSSGSSRGDLRGL
jgi:hypothetical protein